MKIFLPFVLLFPVLCGAQWEGLETEGFTTTPEWTSRKYVATGIVGFVVAANLADAYYTWWKGAEKPFSFYKDGWFNNDHLGIDKVGHFYGTYAFFKGIRTTLLWGGFDRSTAFWWGIGIGVFHAFEIEIGDGFSTYGFDVTDLTCGLLGVAYGVAQTEVPFLQNFDFKVSYWSNTGFRSPANFVSDYDAMTVWCSFNVHNLLPRGADHYWPKWLNIAFGYGTGGGETRREFLFALDLNLSGFSSDSEDIRYVERTLDLVHWPAPGVKFSPGAAPEYALFLLR